MTRTSSMRSSRHKTGPFAGFPVTNCVFCAFQSRNLPGCVDADYRKALTVAVPLILLAARCLSAGEAAGASSAGIDRGFRGVCGQSAFGEV